MTYISLYRKYRPQTFDEVVGQAHITRTLANAAGHGMISHAYLFAGPRGTGKTSVAKILAKAVNCKDGPTSSPCNKCSICREITAGSLVDVLEIDAASNRGIDEIRDLREKVSFAPTASRYKVYIIDEVHMLTTEAFNALLKILEEPPAHVIFVLATTEPHKVLSTILSRCQQFDFRRISVADITDRLKQIATSEKINVDEASLALIAKHAQGSLRDATSTLDQLASFTNKDMKIDDVVTFLGLVDVDLLFETVEALGKKDTKATLFLVDKLVRSGCDLRQFAKELTEHLRNLFILQNVSGDEDQIIDTTPEGLTRMRAQAQHIEPHRVMQFIDILSDTYREMRYSADTRLLLEVALVRMTKLEEESSLEKLVSRVEQLEQRISGIRYGEPKTGTQNSELTHLSTSELGDGRQECRMSDAERSDVESKRPEASLASQLSPPAKACGVSQRGTSLTESEGSSQKPEDRGEMSDDRSQKSDTETRNSEPELRTQSKTCQKLETKDQGAEDASRKQARGIGLDKVKRAWTVILEKVKKEKISTYALLLECQPTRLDKNTLVLEFGKGAVFHKGEVEKPANISVVKNSLKQVLGVDLDISCVLEDVPPQAESQVEVAVRESEAKEEAGEVEERKEDSLSSAIELAQNYFGAEVVDEDNHLGKES